SFSSHPPFSLSSFRPNHSLYKHPYPSARLITRGTFHTSPFALFHSNSILLNSVTHHRRFSASTKIMADYSTPFNPQDPYDINVLMELLNRTQAGKKGSAGFFCKRK